MDGRREGGPEEDGCHRLEDKCTQKTRLEDGREGGQGPTRTVEPWSSSSSSSSSSLGYINSSLLSFFMLSTEVHIPDTNYILFVKQNVNKMLNLHTFL